MKDMKNRSLRKHDYVNKIEIFSALLAFCEGNPPVTPTWIRHTKASDAEF